jgi:hypothetical protein
MATLEFCMALPFLALLMVGITWLGFSVIAQTEALVEARNKAWQKRFDNPGQEPLLFSAGLVVAKNPLYSYDKDYVTESVTKEVNVSPIFSAMPPPKATHTVLGGSWDHRAMDMNSPPNIKLYGKAIANSATADIQTQLGNLTNLLGSLEQAGAAALAQALLGNSNFQQKSQEAQSTGGAGDAETKQQQKEDKEKLEQRLADLGGVINPLNNRVEPVPGGELDKTIDALNDAQAELALKERATPLQDEELEKKRLAELDQLERKVQLLKDKRQRIESEIRDITEELKAFDD